MEQCVTNNIEQFKHGHVYFIHRLPEYFKNRYHSLQHKRWNSIRAIISECLSIQDDINNNPYQANKLQHSLDSQFKALLFWCQHNPLSNHIALKNDLSTIVDLLKTEKEKIDKEAVYHNASALLKRLNRLNMVELVIEYCLLNPQLNYSIIDSLLDTLVSELFFDGFSLTYLEEWYAENIFRSEYIKNLTIEEHRGKLLNKIKDIIQSRKKFEVILNCWLPLNFREELHSNKVIHFELVNTIPVNKLSFKENAEYGLIKIEVEVCDKYKAIEVAIAKVKNYMEAYKLGQNAENEVVVGDSYLVRQDGEFEKVRLSSEKKDFESDEREKDDIKQFIQLRRKLGEESIMLSDIAVIERVLFLINSSKKLSPENRLLNSWSALEYLLTFFHRNSIIEKVIDIVPKTISLYHVKDKMNVLWLRLETYKNSNGRAYLAEFEAQNLELDKLFSLCGVSDNPTKYDKEKFSNYLTSADIVKLRDLMARNIHIYKGICELFLFLTNFETAKKTITTVHDLTVHDLTQIYRIRNKIVHSGKTTSEDMEVIVAKLNRYLNGLVGTLIHYLNLYPGLRISEILYSIEQTYNWYIKELSKKSLQPVKIASPPYLFL